MALTWLADELRKAGLTVVEHTNWKTHDRPGTWSPTYGVVHATAAPRSQKDSVQIGVVRNGRADLPGPIANAVIDRNGVWHLVSAGRCNSTLPGTAGPYKGKGNTNALSTEACNDNRGEPWTEKQYQSYVRGWAAWCKRLGWSADRLVGHKEHTPGRKTDPTFSMGQFRRDVAAALAGKDDDDMPYTEGQLQALPWQYKGRGMPGVPSGKNTLWVLGSIYSTTQALLRAEAGDDADQIIAEIRAQGDRTLAALVEFQDAILAELPDSGPVSREDVVAAFRAVLGSVDGAVPEAA